MGQVEKLDDSGAVAEILGAECNALAVAKAKRFVESFAYTTTALVALEAAIREQYNAAAAEGLIADNAPAAMADLLGSIIRQAAAIEATEI